MANTVYDVGVPYITADLPGLPIKGAILFDTYLFDKTHTNIATQIAPHRIPNFDDVAITNLAWDDSSFPYLLFSNQPEQEYEDNDYVEPDPPDEPAFLLLYRFVSNDSDSIPLALATLFNYSDLGQPLVVASMNALYWRNWGEGGIIKSYSRTIYV